MNAPLRRIHIICRGSLSLILYQPDNIIRARTISPADPLTRDPPYRRHQRHIQRETSDVLLVLCLVCRLIEPLQELFICGVERQGLRAGTERGRVGVVERVKLLCPAWVYLNLRRPIFFNEPMVHSGLVLWRESRCKYRNSQMVAFREAMYL